MERHSTKIIIIAKTEFSNKASKQAKTGRYLHTNKTTRCSKYMALECMPNYKIFKNNYSDICLKKGETEWCQKRNFGFIGSYVNF